MTNWQEKLSEVIRDNQSRTGFTDHQVVRLGDGQEPATVLVPLANREHPNLQTFYVHTNSEGTLNTFQVLNWPGSGVTPDNSTPWLEVVIARVPWSDKMHIISIADGGYAALGAPPLHLGLQQAATITPDRFVQNGLYIASGMVLGFRGGRFRLNNKNVHINPNASFADMTSYVPGTSGKDRWVLISVDDSGAAQVTSGTLFDSTDPNPANYIPINLPKQALYLGRLRLSYGDTALAQTQLYPDADVFFVPAPVYVQGSDPGAVGAGVLWFDTSDGAGAWRLKVRSNANSYWELIASGSTSGSEGSGWTSITVANDGFADIILDAYGDNATDRSRLSLRRGRGTEAAPDAVQSGDSIGDISFKAVDGAGHVEAAAITVTVDGTPGTDDMPGRLTIGTTRDGEAASTQAFSIDSEQVVAVERVLSLGATPQTATLSSGTFTATHSFVVLSAEAGTTDTLTDITATGDKPFIILKAAAGHKIIVEHGTIALNNEQDFLLSGDRQLMLFNDGTTWADTGAFAPRNQYTPGRYQRHFLLMGA